MSGGADLQLSGDERIELQQQMRLIVYSFAFELLVNIIILVFYLRYIPNRECFTAINKEWMSLWPMNGSYVAALRHAHFAESDICVMISTMSLASVVCVATTVPAIILIFIRKPTVYFKNVTLTVIVVFAGITWYLFDGIESRHTLFGPTEDKSIVVNSMYILFMMAIWFFALTFVVDRVRSSIHHAIVDR